MEHRKFHGLVVAVLATAGYGAGAVAQAQSAAATDGDTLQEVVVTAEKREENAQKIAISMEVIDSSQQQKQGNTSLDSMLSNLPAVKIAAMAQGAQIFVRGVGSNMDPGLGDTDVAVSTDGAYSNRSEAILNTMNDVARIEVLRGPQGTLYGRNATGGQVNIITNDPKPVFEASGRFGVGNYGLYSASGVLNVPVASGFALRASFTREQHDGYITDGNLDNNTWSARLKALWQPSDNVKFTPSIDYYDFKGSNIATVFDPARRPAPDYNSNPWWDPYNQNQTGTRSTTINLKSEFTTGIGTVTLTPTYEHLDRCQGVYLINAPGLAPPLAYVGGPPTSVVPGQSIPVNQVIPGQWPVNCGGAVAPAGASAAGGPPTGVSIQDEYTAELRLNSPDSSPVKWVVGLYYYSLSLPSTPVNIASGVSTLPAAANCGTLAASNIDCVELDETGRPTTSYAAFAQATIPANDRLRFVVGARYNRDDHKDNYQIVDYSMSTSNPSVSTHTATSPSSPLTWKVGVEYDAAASSLLYGTISTGYKAGGLAGSVQLDAATNQLYVPGYQPEKLLAFEVGSKSRFLGNRIQVDGSIYYYNYNQFQVQYGGATNAAGFCNCVANASLGKMYGAELEMQWLVTPRDRVDLNATGENAHYGDLLLPGFNAPPGVTPPPNGVFDESGHIMANAPPWTASLGYSHSWTLGGGNLTARGNVHASGGYYSTVEVWFPDIYQKPYATYDATLAYEARKWSLTAWGRNLGNSWQVTSSFPFGRMFITNPRTFGITVAASL